MFLKFYTPHIQLQPFVSSIMLFAAQFDPAMELKPVPYPPLPEQSLFFYPRTPISARIHGEDKTIVNPNSIIVGPQLKRVNITLGHDHIVIRVGFKPGGLHRFTRLPMHEIVDEACNTGDFFHKQVTAVNERLFNTAAHDEMISVVQQFLLEKKGSIKQALPFDHAMNMLVQQNGLIPIEKLASLACTSTRQLERLCRERIGLPPKVFARLTRFSKAYRLYESNPYLSWTHIAHTCGYFDQMHFIRDCKQFAGTVPGTIAKEINGAVVKLQYMIDI